MTERPEQRPEGKLIAAALKRSPLTARDAASKVPLSEGRWYQIIRGYQTAGQGVYAPVRGPAETIAKMAYLVGVSPEQLEEADRADAAEELRLLFETEPEPGEASEVGAPNPLAGLPDDPDERVAALAERIRRNSEDQQRVSEEQRRLSAELERLIGRRSRGEEAR
jgi:hypothetical protein